MHGDIAALHRRIDELENALRRIFTRHMNSAAVGQLVLVDDTGGAQKMQVRLPKGELIDGLPNAQHFGFASNMPPGPQANVTLHFLEGRRTKGIVVATGHQAYRPVNTAVGSTTIYDAAGDSVTLANGSITLTAAANGTVTIHAPAGVRIETPTLACTGEIVANCDAQAIHLTTHTHTEVMRGGSTSGPPFAPS